MLSQIRVNSPQPSRMLRLSGNVKRAMQFAQLTIVILKEWKKMSQTTINTSGLKPLGRAVLVRHYEPERKASLIVMPDIVTDKVHMVEQRAEVIECGPACWPDEPPRAQPGDKILISKMAGYMTLGPADGLRYRLINDRDIFAAISEEKENG